jgi:hypothetical protein
MGRYLDITHGQRQSRVSAEYDVLFTIVDLLAGIYAAPVIYAVRIESRKRKIAHFSANE